ncbi:type II toxin-antitoxin system VapC family toxin [Candidatus Roizmanbacteria bacterium]|nr:type II toxin-antitoxin system VapC family toxin [Candidatus Roizmanbacteria bacterium]
MNKKYLLDTNVVIDFLKGDSKTIYSIRKIIKRPLFISVVTIGEYNYGALRSQNTKNQIDLFKSFCERMKITFISIDKNTIEEYAKLQASLSKKGKLKPIFDLLIASSCIINDCILVTRNKKDFVGIEGLQIL